MMPYYMMQQQLQQRAAYPPPPPPPRPVVVGSKFLPLWTATTTTGGGLQEESSRVPYPPPPRRYRHTFLDSPPPRFYQLDTDLAKLARYPPGCPVVARLDDKNNDNGNDKGTQMILVDVVDTVHVDLVTNVIHYQLACHQYHHHHHAFIPEQALRFGYGTPVWMRQPQQQQGTSSQRVAAQIVATTTTVRGEKGEKEETHYAAQVIGYWSLDDDDTDKEMATTTFGVTHHNIPANHVVYRETLSPLSRVAAADCSCSMSCRMGTTMTTPTTTTMTTNTSHSSTTSDADTGPVHMAAAKVTDTTAEKADNHESSPDDNPLQNMMDWLSSLEQQQQEDEQEGNHGDNDNDRQGDVPQVVEFAPRTAPQQQQQPEPADPAMTSNHTAPSPVTVSSSAATTIATTTSSTTTNTTNTISTNPITVLTVDHDSVTQPKGECTEDVAAPSMSAASADTIIKGTADTTSKGIRESGWLKIACDLQTVPTSTWKTTTVKLNVPPDTTLRIPIWAVTPQMKALFKTKKAILEKKHKCTLDLTNNSTGTHGHDEHVWTIGIYFKTNMKNYPQKRDIVTQALWHTLYDLVFAHAKDENEHENLCLAYDLASENPHMYPPAAQEQRQRDIVGNKTGSANQDMLADNPPIVWQHEGSSQKPKCWMTVLDTYATHHKAVAVLVGPGGLGIREIRGCMLPGVFVCALERPRVGIFLAGNSVRAVQDSLIRARHRLAWAQQRAPRLFGSCLSDTAPATKTDKDKE